MAPRRSSVPVPEDLKAVAINARHRDFWCWVIRDAVRSTKTGSRSDRDWFHSEMFETVASFIGLNANSVRAEVLLLARGSSVSLDRQNFKRQVRD